MWIVSHYLCLVEPRRVDVDDENDEVVGHQRREEEVYLAQQPTPVSSHRDDGQQHGKDLDQ